MREFGWTIEYTLNLSYPVFFELFTLISRVRADAAIDGVYIPYVAAKCGRGLKKHLFDTRGSFFLGGGGRAAAPKCTKRQVATAVERLQAIIDARETALAERAGGC